MKQYYLLSVAGSGGMFVSALMLHYMGLPSDPAVSTTGDCHDLGNGTWKPADDMFLIGDRWEHRAYRRPLLYSHYTDLADVKHYMPELTVVLIDYTDADVELISRLRTVKAHSLQWNQEQYDLLAGPDWPAYSKDNIVESRLIQDELTQMRMPITREWLTHVDRSQVSYTIPFTMITGQESGLNQTVADIFGQPQSIQLDKFIKEYQQVNHTLYQY
jgi:hypothetical protein